MSAVDAEESLAIYKSFCTQTEGVVEYLSIARKLSNLLNVPVPNLRHVGRILSHGVETDRIVRLQLNLLGHWKSTYAIPILNKTA